MKYPYRTASPDRYELLKSFARENRQHPTEAEVLLWEMLKREDDVVFKRQHIIGDCIVDFVSLEKSLVIEVDGGYHAERQQAEDDMVRSQQLSLMGFDVIRFTNEGIFASLDSVIETIMQEIYKR